METENTDTSMSLGASLRTWLDLRDRKVELETKLDWVKERLAIAQEAALNAFTVEGIQQAKVDGRTVFIRRDVWAGPSEAGREALVAALAAYSPTADFVRPTYNANTLSAWVRELERAGEAIPKEIEPCLKLTERFSVRVHG